MDDLEIRAGETVACPVRAVLSHWTPSGGVMAVTLMAGLACGKQASPQPVAVADTTPRPAVASAKSEAVPPTPPQLVSEATLAEVKKINDALRSNCPVGPDELSQRPDETTADYQRRHARLTARLRGFDDNWRHFFVGGSELGLPPAAHSDASRLIRDAKLSLKWECAVYDIRRGERGGDDVLCSTSSPESWDFSVLGYLPAGLHLRKGDVVRFENLNIGMPAPGELLKLRLLTGHFDDRDNYLHVKLVKVNHPVELASRQRNLGRGLAVNGDRIYWTTSPGAGGGSGTVSAGSTQGGPATVLARGPDPTVVAADDDAVYWADDIERPKLMKLDLKKGRPTQILAFVREPSTDTRPDALAVDQNDVYFNERGKGIFAVPKIGGVKRMVADEPGVVRAMWINDQRLIWFSADSERNRARLVARPLSANDSAGAKPAQVSTLVQEDGEFVSLDAAGLDGSAAYFYSAPTKELRRLELSGSGKTTVVAKLRAWSPTDQIAAAQNELFFLSASKLFSLAKTGGEPRALSEGQQVERIALVGSSLVALDKGKPDPGFTGYSGGTVLLIPVP